MSRENEISVQSTSRTDEDLLLELLNSTPIIEGVRTDALRDAGPDWSAAHGGTGTDAEIRALRRVRDAVQAATRHDDHTADDQHRDDQHRDDQHRGGEHSGDLDRILSTVAVRPRWRDGALAWTLDVPADEGLATRALLAWAEITERAPDRLRPCANPECCLFLYDRSNANSARWCSMATCGNRAKARRHYRRSRTSA